MSDRVETLLSRMPSQFKKNPESNNFKLLSLLASGSVENRTTYDTMLKYWDIDQAQGIGLDRLGKDEGITRGNMTDAEYRKMIKIQCIVNLSEGDIPTMNTILDAYMGNHFIGLQDGYVDFEPATLLLHLKNGVSSVPDDLIRRIKPAGVRVYILLSQLVDSIRIYVGTYGWTFNGRICGRFRTASRHGHAQGLPSYQLEEIYDWSIKALRTGDFQAGGIK